jgi:hypothetical protein
MTAQTWASSFEDVPFGMVWNAVQQWILKEEYPPPISKIRERCMDMLKPQDRPKTAQEAWEDVIKAIKRFGSYRMDEAFKTLEERTKRAVRVIGWQNICASEAIGIERANFIKFYDSYNMDAKDTYIFPKALTDKIGQIMADQKQSLLENKGNE